MSSQTSNENHIVLPTYQSVLITTISTVIERMNNGQTFAAWLAIRNLYRWMPTDCQKEVEPLFKKTVDGLNQVNKKTTQMDIYLTRNTRHRKQEQWLFQQNEALCDAIRDSLGKHNWLDRDGTIRARNKEIPTI
jgi:predicted amidophosphoribosyltransferase